MPDNDHLPPAAPARQCPSVLNIRGQHYQCEEPWQHAGVPHGNRGAGAIWTSRTPTRPTREYHPGDRVRFDGHEWTVFISMRQQTPDSPVVIWRPSSGLGEFMREQLNSELTYIPREPDGATRRSRNHDNP
jgi:hypothetical protein